MIEKVNPAHPDKVADRISGAIVDLAYRKDTNPKIAVEVLIGHGDCNIIIETSVDFNYDEIKDMVNRITKLEDIKLNLKIVPQDIELAKNQEGIIKCGDNGIFRGVPLTNNDKYIGNMARKIYKKYPFDGKYIVTDNKIIICQSNASVSDIKALLEDETRELIINPLGYWTGGLNSDSGATNRKLGSDMAGSVTGGGLHGKDLSKADVSLNIYAFKKAQELNEVVEISCAIGDTLIDGKEYSEIVDEAKEYINKIGGFEKFAEWGLY